MGRGGGAGGGRRPGRDEELRERACVCVRVCVCNNSIVWALCGPGGCCRCRGGGGGEKTVASHLFFYLSPPFAPRGAPSLSPPPSSMERPFPLPLLAEAASPPAGPPPRGGGAIAADADGRLYVVTRDGGLASADVREYLLGDTVSGSVCGGREGWRGARPARCWFGRLMRADPLPNAPSPPPPLPPPATSACTPPSTSTSTTSPSPPTAPAPPWRGPPTPTPTRSPRASSTWPPPAPPPAATAPPTRTRCRWRVPCSRRGRG